MATSNLRPSPGGETREIPKHEWSEFLAEFTRENSGSHARLEIMGLDIGRQVETEGRPFDGIAADTKDAEQNVWISFGTGPGDHLTHGVQNVRFIRALTPSGGRGATLEIEARDGTKTLLEVSPDEYMLPR